MQFKIINKFSRRYIHSVALIAITSLATGCSSDTMRFTDGLFTNSTPSQQAAVNRPIQQQAPMQQLPPPIQSGTIESNTLPQPQSDSQSSYNQAQASQYPRQPDVSQPTRNLASNQVAGKGAPPRNLGIIPESVLRESNVSANTKKQDYTVKSGDTLSGIGRRYNTPVKAIKTANGLSSGAIRVGQKLIIPNGNLSPTQTDVALVKANVTPVGVTHTQALSAQVNANGQNNLSPNASTTQNLAAHNNAAQEPKSNMVETVSVRMENPASPSQNLPTNTQQATSDNSKQYQTAQATIQAQNAVATQNDKMTKAEQVAVITPQSTGIAQMRWPVRGRILSSFGQREGTTPNDGLDILVPEGTSVRAAENGVVIYADDLKKFGNTVLIRHENNIVTVYGHNSKILVKRNQQVRRGDEIAKSGMSGDATTPKLHFEVRQNSAPVNPVKFLEN